MAACVAAVGAVSGQEPTVYRSETQMVPVYATVVDDRGRLVTDLAPADFAVIDNGRPVATALFSNDPQPFTAVVMLDTSDSVSGHLDLLKRAGEEFLARLPPGGRARLCAFSDRIHLSAAFSSDAGWLRSELAQLKIGNATRMYDAIAASLDALRDEAGLRAIVLLTDGDDTASRTRFRTVLERARKGAVMVYTVRLTMEYVPGALVVKSMKRQTRDLRRLADATGGGYFELLQTADPAPTLARVVEELRSQYLLGFIPRLLDGGTHALDVRIGKAGLKVRSRPSYVATRR